MNRRGFLQLLLSGAVTTAAAPSIFVPKLVVPVWKQRKIAEVIPDQLFSFAQLYDTGKRKPYLLSLDRDSELENKNPDLILDLNTAGFNLWTS